MACWIRLTEGQARASQKEAEKLRKQQDASLPWRSLPHLGGELPSLLLSLSPPVPISVLPLGISHPTSDLAAGQQASRARTTGSGNARPISITSSTDANGFHARTADPLCPCAVDCRARRRAPISSTVRDHRQHDISQYLSALLQRERSLAEAN